VPAQDGVGSEEGADFRQELAAEDFAFDGESAALIIVEQDTARAELLFEDLVLGAEEVDHFLLAVVDPADHAGDQNTFVNRCARRKNAERFPASAEISALLAPAETCQWSEVKTA